VQFGCVFSVVCACVCFGFLWFAQEGGACVRLLIVLGWVLVYESLRGFVGEVMSWAG